MSRKQIAHPQLMVKEYRDQQQRKAMEGIKRA
jgi:hypothetical protein